MPHIKQILEEMAVMSDVPEYAILNEMTDEICESLRWLVDDGRPEQVERAQRRREALLNAKDRLCREFYVSKGLTYVRTHPSVSAGETV